MTYNVWQLAREHFVGTSWKRAQQITLQPPVSILNLPPRLHPLTPWSPPGTLWAGVVIRGRRVRGSHRGDPCRGWSSRNDLPILSNVPPSLGVWNIHSPPSNHLKCISFANIPLFRGEITPLSSSYNISVLVPVCWLLFQCFWLRPANLQKVDIFAPVRAFFSEMSSGNLLKPTW